MALSAVYTLEFTLNNNRRSKENLNEVQSQARKNLADLWSEYKSKNKNQKYITVGEFIKSQISTYGAAVEKEMKKKNSDINEIKSLVKNPMKIDSGFIGFAKLMEENSPNIFQSTNFEVLITGLQSQNVETTYDIVEARKLFADVNGTINQTHFANYKLGWTQGNFSQYLSGGVPIGMTAVEILAPALKCKKSDIMTDFRDPGYESLKEALRESLLVIEELNIDSSNESVINFLDKAKDALAA